MIQKTDTHNTAENCSFRNAHILNEFAKVLHKVGDDIENSVGVFDAIGEKNEIFSQLEESIQRPAIESLIQMQDISQGQIYNFVFKSFEETFKKYASNFNFIHFANATDKDLTFFISVKDDKITETLENLEYDYFTSEIHNYLDVNFCFLESDMEKDLSNTEKMAINV